MKRKTIILTAAICICLLLFSNVFAIGDVIGIMGATTESSNQVVFNNQVALAQDASGNIYVADMGNHRIVKLSSTGALLQKFGSLGSGIGEFDTPFGVAIDNNGDILVADTANYRIQKFDSSFNYITQWGTQGSGQGEFELVREIGIDSNNNYHVCDEFNNRIQVFDDTGTYLFEYGTKGTAAGQFNLPQGIAVDTTGATDRVFVCDTYNNRIQIFDTSGNYLDQIGSLTQGDGNYTFYHPRGVNIDSSNGNIYIADTYNHKIKVYNNSQVFQFSVSVGTASLEPVYPCQVLPVGNNEFIISDTGNSQLIWRNKNTVLSHIGTLRTNGMYSGVAGVTTDSYGNLYVTDSMNHRVLKYNSSGSLIAKWGGNSGNGTPSSYGTMYWQFTAPKQISYDQAYNRILIADTGNSRIQVYNASGAWISNFGYGVFSNPMGVCTDSYGNIYISDTGHNRIMKCNAWGITVTTWGSYGTGNGQFNMPCFIACDSNNNVYVVDRGNCRVQKFSSNGTFITAWGTNNGVPVGGPLDNEGHGDGDFFLPIGICVDEDDNVYVTDSSNNRVQVFTSSGQFIEKFGYFSGNDDGFFSPQGITVHNGRVYVADSLLNRITIFDQYPQ